MRPWLNWIEHLATDQGIGGSNPPGRTTLNNRKVIFQTLQAIVGFAVSTRKYDYLQHYLLNLFYLAISD